MGTTLMLDAAYPPSPQQWIADMNAVNAGVGAIYIWSGFPNYSKAHVDAARAAGKFVLPIVVPGDIGPDPNTVLDVANQFGITSGPIAVDLETGSEPGNAWDQTFDSVARNRGFTPIEYGTPSQFGPWGGQYTDSDSLWIATWIRTGIINPVPVLPPGRVAWQFVNDVTINNSQYDASVIDTSIFEGGTPPMPNVQDVVVPAQPVPGKIYHNAQWYNWSDLTPLQTTDQTGSTGATMVWTEAKEVNGIWYDRVNGGAWALNDADIDDGGHDPTFFRPPPPPPPPPAPDLTPRVVALENAVGNLQAMVAAMQASLAKVKGDL